MHRGDWGQLLMPWPPECPLLITLGRRDQACSRTALVLIKDLEGMISAFELPRSTPGAVSGDTWEARNWQRAQNLSAPCE